MMIFNFPHFLFCGPARKSPSFGPKKIIRLSQSLSLSPESIGSFDGIAPADLDHLPGIAPAEAMVAGKFGTQNPAQKTT